MTIDAVLFRCPLWASDKLRDLVVQAVVLVKVPILVPMTEVPPFHGVLYPAADGFEELCRRICFVGAGEIGKHVSDDAVRAGMGQDVVDVVSCGKEGIEAVESLHAFHCARDFFFPPADVLRPLLLVNGLRSAHREEVLSFDGVNLPAHEMDDVLGMREDLDVSTVPFGDRKPMDPVEVFVVPVDPEDGIWLLIEPMLPIAEDVVFFPEKTEISKDDDVIFSCELLLLPEVGAAEALDVDGDMGVPCQVNHVPLLPEFCCIVYGNLE